MSQGLPRSHPRDPVFSDWGNPPKFYSPDLSRKYFPGHDNSSHDSGSLQLKHRKPGPAKTQKEKEAKQVNDVFSRFADTTSLHALPFINRASRWYAKLIWAIIFILATGTWIFHSTFLIKTYIASETTSSVKIVYETIDYPSITLCNINPIREEALEKYATDALIDYIDAIQPNTAYKEDRELAKMTTVPNVPDITGGTEGEDTTDDFTDETNTGPPPTTGPGILRRKKRYEDQSIEYYEYDEYEDMDDFQPFDIDWSNYIDFVNDYSDVLESSDVRDYVKTVTVFKELLANVTDSNRVKMGHQLSTMMMSCSYDGKQCTVRNFSRQIDIDHGVCWTFNSFLTSQAAVTSARSGSTFGLDLILYIQDESYIPGLQLGRGIRLDVHSFGSMPFVKDNGISVAPGQQAYVGLRVLNQTRLGGRYGTCNDDDGSFRTYYNNTYSYTIEGCINTCLDRTIADKCNCFRRTQRQYYNRDDLQKGFCKTDKEIDCTRQYVEQYTEGDLNCGCHQGCQTVEYETVYSYDLWPDESLWYSLTDAICVRDTSECERVKSISETDRLEFLRSNFIHLKIFYRDLNVQKIDEQPSYEFVQFGSDLGGAIGLWIGASLITVFEFIELFLQLCNYCRRKPKYKERKMHQRANQYPQDHNKYLPREYIVRGERPNSDVVRPYDRHMHSRH